MHIGIDFGTSNTAVAAINGNAPTLVPLEAGRESIPTAVFYGVTDRQYCIGNDAIDMYDAGEDGRLMRSIKSVLGTTLIEETTQLGSRSLPFRKVIDDFILRTVRLSEAYLGREIKTVVQGRPVSFNDHDAERDQRAQDILESSLQNAGVETVVFVKEPVAAAKSVNFPLGREKLLFVIDIGGGTSDFSVIRVPDDNGAFEVLASTGVYIGGNDFDRVLSFYELAPLFGKDELLERNGLPMPSSLYTMLSDWKSLNRLYSRDTQKTLSYLRLNSPNSSGIKALDYLIENFQGHSYAAATEAIKIDLSAKDAQDFVFRTRDAVLQKTVLRRDFERLLEEPVGKMEATAHECLKRANVQPDQITDIVLVGGSTLIPFVTTRLSRPFAHASIAKNDRFSAVAKGLAVFGQEM